MGPAPTGDFGPRDRVLSIPPSKKIIKSSTGFPSGSGHVRWIVRSLAETVDASLRDRLIC